MTFKEAINCITLTEFSEIYHNVKLNNTEAQHLLNVNEDTYYKLIKHYGLSRTKTEIKERAKFRSTKPSRSKVFLKALGEISEEELSNLYHNPYLSTKEKVFQLGISESIYYKLIKYYKLSKTPTEIRYEKQLAASKVDYSKSCTKRTKVNFIKYGVGNPRVLLHPESYSYSYYKTDTFRKKIEFETIKFDSSWELYYFIYMRDIGTPVARYTGTGLDYIDAKGIPHKYFPDFVLNEELIEIKGPQFLDKNLNLVDPYGNNYKSGAKTKCMLDNNVRLVLPISMQYIIQIVEQKYGKEYYKSFIN